MVALAADHIIARETSVTGSIGVLLETAEISGLLEMLGITAETIRSAPLKGTPSLFEPLTEETRAATQSVVDDIYEWFVALFADRRGLELDSARGLADGRIFTGRQALALGMIDATGGEEDAIVWLEQSRGIETDLPVIDIQPEIDHGITEFLTSLGQKTLLSERLRLDGLLSVWQPDR
jgi:protease-4